MGYQNVSMLVRVEVQPYVHLFFFCCRTYTYIEQGLMVKFHRKSNEETNLKCMLMFGTIMKELRNGSIPPHDHISHKCESQLLTGVLFGHQFMKHKAGF